MIRKMPSQAKPLIFISDAGPCGSWLSRSLTNKGYDGWGVAPSLLPQKPGDRVQTDRRDAVPLARLARAGDLPAVSVPTVADEALRDLTRARDDPMSELKDAQLRLTACLLRHDIRDTGRAHWGPAHLRWRSAVGGPMPAPPMVFQDSVRAVQEPTDRLQRLAQARREPVNAWRLSPVVEALQALRGVPCPVAVTLVAAMGDLTRFASPRARLQFLGLLPSAYASGAPRRQGAMTQAGNPHARRVLVAGAWASRSPAKGSRHWPLRRDHPHPPTIIQDIRWKAQVRLWNRSRRLVSRGQHAHVVPVAMARELTGGLWAMAKQVPRTPSVQPSERIPPRTQQVSHRASAETPPRCGVTLGGVKRLVKDPRASSRGRHPTEARKVGAHPRRAAGSTVAYCWLRLFRCIEVKKPHEDLKKSAHSS
jgi:transposase